MDKFITYQRKAVRAAAILTTGYVAGTVINDVEGDNQLVLEIDFTIGDLTDCQIKVEFSGDGSDYFQQATTAVAAGVQTVSAGVYKLTATGKYYIPIEMKTSKIKISAIGTGTVTGSLLKINAVHGVS